VRHPEPLHPDAEARERAAAAVILRRAQVVSSVSRRSKEDLPYLIRLLGSRAGFGVNLLAAVMAMLVTIVVLRLCDPYDDRPPWDVLFGGSRHFSEAFMGEREKSSPGEAKFSVVPVNPRDDPNDPDRYVEWRWQYTKTGFKTGKREYYYPTINAWLPKTQTSSEPLVPRSVPRGRPGGSESAVARSQTRGPPPKRSQAAPRASKPSGDILSPRSVPRSRLRGPNSRPRAPSSASTGVPYAAPAAR
jgi:hypothetical protein